MSVFLCVLRFVHVCLCLYLGRPVYTTGLCVQIDEREEEREWDEGSSEGGEV